MAVSTSIVQTPRSPGDQMFAIADITCSEKYVAEGEVVKASEFNLRTFAFVFPLGVKTLGSGSTVNIANAVFSVSSNKTEGKLILRDETPAEVASEAEIKKPVITLCAFGKP
jgi:hypothetical protein